MAYAGLKFYAEPIEFLGVEGNPMMGSLVLMVRQKDSAQLTRKKGETMRFNRSNKWKQQLQRILKYTDPNEVRVRVRIHTHKSVSVFVFVSPHARARAHTHTHTHTHTTHRWNG